MLRIINKPLSIIRSDLVRLFSTQKAVPVDAASSIDFIKTSPTHTLLSPQQQQQLPPQHGTSFHKRPLPKDLIALSSTRGKQMFREALAAGTLESYFPLSEQFVTQSEPSFCSLSSLAMVLNALNYDLKKVWKGPWRWVSEETLQCDVAAQKEKGKGQPHGPLQEQGNETRQLQGQGVSCCHSVERIQKEGMDFQQFELLARCHGVHITSYRALPATTTTIETIATNAATATTATTSNAATTTVGTAKNAPVNCKRRKDFQQFLALVESTSRDPTARSFLICNFSRRALGQTGDGHYSPIAGFHRSSNNSIDVNNSSSSNSSSSSVDSCWVLLLDVARFKYPPYWVRAEQLYAAMAEVDSSSGRPRGYFSVCSWDDINQRLSYLPQHATDNTNTITDTYAPPFVAAISSDVINSNSSSGSCSEGKYPSGAALTTDGRSQLIADSRLANVSTGSGTFINRTSCPPKIRTWENAQIDIRSNNSSSCGGDAAVGMGALGGESCCGRMEQCCS